VKRQEKRQKRKGRTNFRIEKAGGRRGVKRHEKDSCEETEERIGVMRPEKRRGNRKVMREDAGGRRAVEGK